MTELNDYIINLNTLKDGVHKFEYQLDDAFFSAIGQQEILGGNVHVELALTVLRGGFMLEIQIDGEVQVVCDRCLDEMTQHVEGQENLPVRLTNTEADEDVVAVDPETGLLDTSWLLYELTEISLPIVHSHQPGECNPQMEEFLQSHLCTTEEEPEE